MAAVFKLQFFIIVIICFHSSHGFKLPYNGVKIVTYGEPCHPLRHLPITIEEAAKQEPVPEFVSPKPCVYQPLKLNYRVISTKPILYQPRAEYPISIQVPQVPQPLETITPDVMPLQGKSYAYSIQTLPPPHVPISTRYDFDFQVPPSPSSISTPQVSTPQPVKLLTSLTSKIDRILIPACQVPSSNCCKTVL